MKHLMMSLSPRTWLSDDEFRLLEMLDHRGGVEVIGRHAVSIIELLDIRGLVVIEEYRYNWFHEGVEAAYAYINEAGLTRLKYERAIRKIRGA